MSEAPDNAPIDSAPAAGGLAEQPVPLSTPLPDVETGLDVAAVIERLGVASRRGRLAGYTMLGGGRFEAAAFGNPFDGVVACEAERRGDRTRLVFRSRMLTRTPAIFALVMVFTIWPGVYFMDQMMIQFLPGARSWAPTWWWYLPLTILTLPWLWRTVMRRSRATIHDSAHRAIAKIAAELDGRVLEPTGSALSR